MDTVHFTDDEIMALHDVVKTSLSELRTEISYTETRDFKDALRKRQEMLQTVFEKLEAAVGQTVQPRY